VQFLGRQQRQVARSQDVFGNTLDPPALARLPDQALCGCSRKLQAEVIQGGGVIISFRSLFPPT
jgi:hypothetical protein